MSRCLAVLILFRAAHGLSDSHMLDERLQGTHEIMQGIAAATSEKLMEKARLQAQFASDVGVTKKDGMSQEELAKLFQDVQQYAEETKRRVKIEMETGVVNNTRLMHHRKALEQITKIKRNNELIQKFRAKKHYLSDSSAKLFFLEAMQAMAVGAAAYGNMASRNVGIMLCGLFFSSSVLVYLDAGFEPVDAIYWAMQIPTTIGYGDLSLDHGGMEDTHPLMIWTTLHVGMNAMFGCLGFQALAETLVLNHVIDLFATHNDRQLDNKANLVLSFSMWVCIIGAAAVFYSNYEHCTCSYGNTRVSGCDENDCANTDGIQMDLVDAVYMMVASASSVGFGDFAPKTKIGRALGIPLLSMSNFINDNMGSAVYQTISNIFGRAMPENLF